MDEVSSSVSSSLFAWGTIILMPGQKAGLIKAYQPAGLRSGLLIFNRGRKGSPKEEGKKEMQVRQVGGRQSLP